MDSILIEALQVETIIGVHESEKQHPQLLLISLEMMSDFERAARSDALCDALDYDALSHQLMLFVKAQQVELLETLATRVANYLEKQFSPHWFNLLIKKPGALNHAKSAGVRIERGFRKI